MEIFNGIHYAGKGDIQPTPTSLTNLMVVKVEGNPTQPILWILECCNPSKFKSNLPDWVGIFMTSGIMIPHAHVHSCLPLCSESNHTMNPVFATARCEVMYHSQESLLCGWLQPVSFKISIWHSICLIEFLEFQGIYIPKSTNMQIIIRTYRHLRYY